MPQLETLCLHLLSFKGYEVRQLRRLRADLDLTLHGVVSKGGFWELRHLPTLTALTLLHSRPGNFPFPLKRLRGLRRLKIQCGTLDDKDLSYLSDIEDCLSALEISLVDTDPITLSRICDSTALITALSVKMEILQCDRSLGNLSKLEFLLVEATEAPFSSDDILCLLQSTRLKHLHVIGCLDWSPILASEVLGSNVVSLTIGWSQIQGEDLAGLTKLEGLHDLTLYICPVLDTLSPLRDMTQLRSLTMSQCSQLEESMEEILLSSLPEGLEQLNLGFGDGLDFEAHEDLLLMLNERYPHLEVLPATRMSDYCFTS